MLKTRRLLLACTGALAVLVFLPGCTRDMGDSSKTTTLHIQGPQKIPMNQSNIMGTPPADKLWCYGVSVSGAGLPFSPASSCSPALGITGGFALSGQPLSVILPQGSQRKIEVFVYIPEAGVTSCPGWNRDVNSPDVADYGKTYKIGEVAGVDMYRESMAVTVQASFPGLEHSLKNDLGLTPGNCSEPGLLRSVLYSDGSILNPGGSLFSVDNSRPMNDSHFEASLSSGHTGAGQDLGAAVLFPPFAQSIAKKPDTGKYYGLLAGGQVVEVSTAGEVLSSGCPFDSCQVPVWIQSISAGTGASLFGLDHAGQIYKVMPDGSVQQLSKTVGPRARQVTYY